MHDKRLQQPQQNAQLQMTLVRFPLQRIRKAANDHSRQTPVRMHTKNVRGHAPARSCKHFAPLIHGTPCARVDPVRHRCTLYHTPCCSRPTSGYRCTRVTALWCTVARISDTCSLCNCSALCSVLPANATGSSDRGPWGLPGPFAGLMSVAIS